MLNDRVRQLEERTFRLNAETQTTLLVTIYLFDRVMPADLRARTAAIDDVEALVGAQIGNIRSAMTPVETDALPDEMQDSVARIMGLVRDGLGLPRK
jgi:hypothetical protein